MLFLFVLFVLAALWSERPQEAQTSKSCVSLLKTRNVGRGPRIYIYIYIYI